MSFQCDKTRQEAVVKQHFWQSKRICTEPGDVFGPAELCETEPGQPRTGVLSKHASQEMVKNASGPPYVIVQGSGGKERKQFTVCHCIGSGQGLKITDPHQRAPPIIGFGDEVPGDTAAVQHAHPCTATRAPGGAWMSVAVRGAPAGVLCERSPGRRMRIPTAVSRAVPAVDSTGRIAHHGGRERETQVQPDAGAMHWYGKTRCSAEPTRRDGLRPGVDCTRGIAAGGPYTHTLRRTREPDTPLSQSKASHRTQNTAQSNKKRHGERQTRSAAEATTLPRVTKKKGPEHKTSEKGAGGGGTKDAGRREKEEGSTS
ncbi:hypothetical protein DFH11DRAFT_1548340 [Phellopilus nigrolimitatus]|nr:hypothetical protein DFH11DRAFT_1548340 [Phellopilus nigrolimitatus]